MRLIKEIAENRRESKRAISASRERAALGALSSAAADCELGREELPSDGNALSADGSR